MRVVWSGPASRDLERITAYIAERNLAAAKKVAGTIYNGCASLKEFPLRGRHSRMDGRRDLVFAPLPYIAVYRVTDHAIEIIRIYHTSRDWP